MNVNLPLLDMIEKMPAYAKIFKSLHANRQKFWPNHQECITGNASAVLQKELPPKLKDPGSFCINITVGDTKLEKAMLDLGSSINLMPLSIYKQLEWNELKPTTMSLLLADGSVRYPRGIVEDVLVQVDKLIIPADFVVLDMDDVSRETNIRPILLGRPFMKTARTIIDVHEGKLSMTVLDETVEFKVFKSDLKDISSVDCFAVDTLPSQDYSKNANEYLDEILALFEEKCEEGGQVGDTCDKQSSLEIIELKSENANLLKEVEALRKERDEANKRAEDLARLVEEQEEDFARKTRKLQLQVELKDKTIDSIKEESSRKEIALKVAKVKQCDCLVELERAEQTIEMLTKEASKKEETLKVNTIKGNSNHPNARVNKTKGSPSYFPYKCYFCNTRGHKIAHCAKFIEVCKKKQSMPMGKPKRIRQVWVQKEIGRAHV